MIALAGYLDLLGSCVLTGLTTVFVASLHHAPARQMRALARLIGCHDSSSFPNLPAFGLIHDLGVRSCDGKTGTAYAVPGSHKILSGQIHECNYLLSSRASAT
jgi:hypothetical protein